MKAGAPAGDRTEASLATVPACFARTLRRAGLEVPVSAVISFAEALELVGLVHPGHVYWAGRCVFVHSPDDVTAYGQSFASYFGGIGATGAPMSRQEASVTILPDAEGDVEASATPDAHRRPSAATITLRYSPAETLRHKDFAALSPDERDEAYRLIAALRAHPPRRLSRRRRPVGHRRGALDLRRSVRKALRTSGEPVALRRLGRVARARRVVLLLDVSGSMEPYSRALLRFAHSAVMARNGIEAFTLGTRLTRVTRELSWHDPDRALGRAAASVVDMAGGTRLGPSLHSFIELYGATSMARGAVVVILSDGWDRGDPKQLAAEMARLSRLAYRIVWVNPLKASPGYAPLARGMAAALPYVDEFVEGHSYAALERLVGEVMTR